MKYTKIIISLLIVFLFSTRVFAQKELKYKDIYEFVSKTDTIQTYEQMKAFQKQDPQHANSYYQLGLIAQSWSGKYDPLTQASDVRYFIYHTKVYLGLAKQNLDEKEVRKNREYYQNITVEEGEKLSLEKVIAEIDQRIETSEEFSTNFESLYTNFTKSVNAYNTCVKLFLEINKNNTKEKELLMTINEQLKTKIKELETNYDSTLFYLEAFEANLKKYPIKGYQQQHRIKKIDTYRLEGLTYSNFLENDIELWDFKQWTNNFNSLLNNDINRIRTKVDSTHKSLNQFSSNYRTTKIHSDSNAIVKINPKILFKIGKYDYNSVLIDFLNYEESKANYLRFSKKVANNILDSTKVNLKKKAYFYNKLLENKQHSDKLAKITTEDINTKSIAKYKDFIQSNYQNIDGFKAHIETEITDNNKIFENSLDNYKHFMYQDSKIDLKDTALVFGKYSILLKLSTGKKNLEENETFTENISISKNGEAYISGKINISGKEKAFLCLASDMKIKWFKTYSNKEATANSGLILEAGEESCFLIVSSIEGSNCTNKLLKISNTGRKLMEKELVENKVPRYLNYDDINEKILIAYYGNTQESYSSTIKELLIASYNTELKISPSWTNAAKLNLIGDFVDIIQINESIYVFSNFHEYKNINSQSMFVPEKSSPNQLNALLTVINKEGTITKMIPFLSNDYYYLTNIVKVDNNLINLIGIKGEVKEAKKAIGKEAGKLHYMLLNAKGELTYSN